MEKKQLILLKIVKSNHDNHRLRLLKKDYERLIKDKKIQSLKIDFNGEAIIDFTKSMVSYTTEGQLAQKGRISTWILSNGFLESNPVLLFELTTNDKISEHYYRYLGDADALAKEIAEADME